MSHESPEFQKSPHMTSTYDLDKIKFATDVATFQRAVGLYESGKVTEVKEVFDDYKAVVLGTKPYRVSVSGRRYKDAQCTCYVGQREMLCKHAVALALYAVMDGQPLTSDDKKQRQQAECSGRREALSKEGLTSVKKAITESMRYIKSYTGPSRTWFVQYNTIQYGVRSCDHISALLI